MKSKLCQVISLVHDQLILQEVDSTEYPAGGHLVLNANEAVPEISALEGRIKELEDALKKSEEEKQVLYDHRNALFGLLCATLPRYATFCEDPENKDWYLAYFQVPVLKDKTSTAQISYHLPYSAAKKILQPCFNPEAYKQWDGHTSEQVLYRINEAIEALNQHSHATRPKQP